jgi:sulfite exporter TauE/SafE
MLTLGLVTSLHCVSMCGPMVVSYALKGTEDGSLAQRVVPNLAYQIAKLVSYVLVGVVLGGLGSAFNIDGIRPYIMFVAGGFMIVLGLGMTGRVPWAAKLTPRPPKFLMDALVKTRRKASADAEKGISSLGTPITFGLLTGLMPCAPLMGAELAAAGTGSPLLGGLAMFAFGIGTAPLMIAFGTASGLIPKVWKERMMVALAVVVIVLGGVYINRGLMRVGSPVTFQTVKSAVLGSPATSASSADFQTGADGVVEVPLTIENVKFSPANLSIPADKPVRLVVTRNEENACSAQLSIPQLGIMAVDLKANGVTTIDLPASKAGAYTLTCGMGMMSGQLTVGGGAARSPGGSGIWLLVAVASAAAAAYVSRRRSVGAGSQRTPATHPVAAAKGRTGHGATTHGSTPARGPRSSGSSGEPVVAFGLTPTEVMAIGGLLFAAIYAGNIIGRL